MSNLIIFHIFNICMGSLHNYVMLGGGCVPWKREKRWCG